jgi:ribonuclease Z
MLLLILALSGSVVGHAAAPQKDSLVVTLLGTGTPNPRVERLGPSTLIEAGDKRLLFDVGRGAAIRLEQAGVRPGSITPVFLTHLHSDHTVGLPDLWLTGWLPPFGGRATSLRVIGPAGTRQLVSGLKTAFNEDVRMRTREEGLPASGIALEATEFNREMTVFDEGGVRVSAFEVNHGGELKPAYGYRISYGGRSVVISGDTRYSENLIRHAAGADVLIHEVAMAPKEITNQKAVQFILSHHTSPAEAAQVFAKSKPRLAVFTHFAFPPNRRGSGSSADDVVAEATQHYSGRMIAGEDLMRIVVADTIEVQHADGQSSAR